MKVVIFGCGPAGLFAAHAATLAGHEVAIYSKPRKSRMHGAQYLHRPIPGLSEAPFQVKYLLEGTVEGYKNKVYGDTSDVAVSPETLVGEHLAWDIREAYDKAWDLYGDSVLPWDFETGIFRFPATIVRSDLIVSTIPAPLLCRDENHKFESQKVWATDMVKHFWDELGEYRDNTVICSGLEDDWWYRASSIQGWENTEFPHDRRPKESDAYGVWEVTKPIGTDCTCSPGIMRVGRYGAWQKGVLSDEGYYATEQALN